MYEVKNPKPGTDEAKEQGCTCPVYDNCHGLGVNSAGEIYGWWIDSACKVHGREAFKKALGETEK